MIWKIEKRMEEHKMIEAGDRVLAGVSGGADSLCLAELLFNMKKEKGFLLGVMHCHHGLRGESADEDERYVRQFCQERNLPYYMVKADVGERARRERMTVEEAGRRFRYESFQEVMEKEGYNVLALAHHANDRTETMLFHLARGTNLAGLASMRPVRSLDETKKLVRPLLWTGRQEIEAWLREKGLFWRTDETNAELVYSRNQIRARAVPALCEVNSSVHQHMGELADGIKEALDFMEEETDKLLEQCLLEHDLEKKRLLLSIPALNKGHTYIKKSVIYRSLCSLSGGKKDVERIHVRMVLDLVERQSGKSISLLRGIRVSKEYEKLIFEKDENRNLEREQEEILAHIRMEADTCLYSGEEILKNEYTKYFDCDKIKFDPCLRFWEEGDFFYLREDGGRKLLSRYFIDRKIPPEQRKRIPLLADGEHVMWLIGHRISGYYKVTEKTKNILKVTVENKG